MLFHNKIEIKLVNLKQTNFSNQILINIVKLILKLKILIQRDYQNQLINKNHKKKNKILIKEKINCYYNQNKLIKM